jgi:hypothetical protein
MATWEDGPEYAPVERPSAFAEPEVAPLDVAPPVAQQAALAPKERPIFADPPVPISPLATLLPVVADVRDPQQPFDVASSTMTSDSAWGALHGTHIQGAGVEPTGPWGPPAPTSWPAPEQPLVISTAANTHGGFPAPGTPGWFSPGEYGAQPDSRPAGPAAVLDAATPGLCICLLLGGLVWVIAPIMLAVTLGLSGRVKAAKADVRRAFTFGVGLFVLLAVLGALVNQTGFSGWWQFAGISALVICWLLLVATLLLVRRGLTTPAAPPPRRATWG